MTRRPAGGMHRLIGMALGIAALASAVVAAQPPAPAQALSGSDFDAGYIISDEKFYDSDAMTQAEIQAFLDAKVGTCRNGQCLNVYRMDTTSRAGNAMCGAYAGASQETVAAIIAKVQRACGISAKVILATLQKEQSLVTHTAPTLGVLERAMGYYCPDDPARPGWCNPEYGGVYNQIYRAAWQFERYRLYPNDYRHQAGTTEEILYDTTASCGTKQVYIRNSATAGLYNYTPYTPNAAALSNLYGEGDACSSYGNRNFWRIYSDWFGSPDGDPLGALQTALGADNTVTVTGWAVDPDQPSASILVRIRTATGSSLVRAYQETTASTGAFYGAGSNHGFSSRVLTGTGSQTVCVDAVNIHTGADVQLGCQTVTVPSAIDVTRTSGPDRFATSVQVARNYAPGVAVAYVASAENFPDALSVTAAAGTRDAPLLLTHAASIPDTVVAELDRLSPGRIVVVGSPAAVSEAVVERLRQVAPVERIGGRDRHATSILVGDHLVTQARSGKAYIASGLAFPDALSASAAAGKESAPIVLLDGRSTTLPSAVGAALTRWGVSQVVVVGGPPSVSQGLEDALRQVPGVDSVTRLAGADRYATSLAVNSAAFGSGTPAYLASGQNFPDALSGGALAGSRGAPLFLSRPDCVPRATLQRLLAADVPHLTVLGGTPALAVSVETLQPCR